MEKLLKKLNPWWVSRDIFNKDKTILRSEYFEALKQLLPSKEIITISGLRRAGKSTLQFQLIKSLIIEDTIDPKNILFFNIDALEIKEKNLDALNQIKETFLKLNNPKDRIYIFLDEIQNLENWENWIKFQYDQNKNIKFILTGSNSKLLYSELSKLLTGRLFNVQIFTLGFDEFLKFKNFKYTDLDYDKITLFQYFNEYLQFGGFPEVVLENNDEVKLLRLQEYYNSIVLRDVLQLNNVRDVKHALDFSKYILSLSAKLFSYNKVAKLIGLSKNTVKEYFNYCQNAFLYNELEKFDFSLKKQMLSLRKNYTLDNGIINAISFKFSDDLGRLLENLVYIELKRRKHDVYYHFDKKECDFVIKKGLKIIQAIQVTKSLNDEKTKQRETAGLMDAMNKYNLKSGLILTYDEESTEEYNGKKVIIKPIWRWLLDKREIQ